MGNWQARTHGLSGHVSTPVINVLGVKPTEDGARRVLSLHLRKMGEDAWGEALTVLGEDEPKYIEAYRRSELLFASADAIRSGANAVEFPEVRYELRTII